MSDPTTLEIVSAETKTVSANTSAQSSAFGTANSGQPNFRQLVRVVATVDGYMTAPAANPTAVAEAADTIYLPAGAVEYFDVALGTKVAFISTSAGKINFAVMKKVVG